MPGRFRHDGVPALQLGALDAAAAGALLAERAGHPVAQEVCEQLLEPGGRQPARPGGAADRSDAGAARGDRPVAGAAAADDGHGAGVPAALPATVRRGADPAAGRGRRRLRAAGDRPPRRRAARGRPVGVGRGRDGPACCSPTATACGSGTRWCGRRSTRQPPAWNDGRRTGRSRRPSARRATPTGRPGTAPPRPKGPTRTWSRRWNAPRPAPSGAAATWRRPPPTSAPPS